MSSVCNGIAVLVYEMHGRLKGLCTGISSHDELCREDEDLRLGRVEPYRFELLYPNNLVYDRGAESLPVCGGLFGEQPPLDVWKVAKAVSEPYFMKHGKNQLQNAYLIRADLRGADLRGADLTWANLTGANLTGADLTGADLTWADLRWANLSGANLRKADLRWANLTGAKLRKADLTGAKLDFVRDD